ncbi:thiosulfate/3-mercaptopyruvate sulfurtransferase [Mucilaginibacter pineti]|uniref:Thiosulfate/3-mercaptopyruvate sulfurtransferase n=1 Tax=Mucilaginibacter pineti TaxID=1391627 RepID=A0A1G7MGU7_9SPHI|nr:sulfurtransferase [Mucilaginibacter pineti]SDF60913.1 thiosulfate/3-mercaptopyruvate sulfurtransferase [Mucilaginibacter pineti]
MLPLIEINAPAFAGANTILIDARAGKDTHDRYLAGHLKNAAHVDLDRDLAAEVTDAAKGGRHPLPNINDFATLLGKLGITPNSHVIVYDDKAGAFGGARFWWMLRAIGHTNVQVLNGGLQAAVNAGIELSKEEYTPTPVAAYPVPAQFEGTVDIKETAIAAQSANRMVIDVRETPRYLGQTEPLDLIAGHIPGAYNLPYTFNLGADGRYLDAETLKTKYEETIGEVAPENVIVHCGSGVTACHTLLGMEHAGISGPQLYVGSWSEWSRRGLPIGTTER